MKTYTYEQEVRYAETDRMKVVHHSTYLVWFELGRTGLLKDAGYPYHELEASGTMFPVIEYSCRLVDSSDYGDVVTVVTHISELKSRTVAFAYEVFVGERKIATGMTRHVAMDGNSRIHRIPDTLLRALEAYAGPEG